MKFNIQKNISVLLAFWLLTFMSLAEKIEARIELIDRVVAVVETSVIMETELNKRVGDIIARLRSEGTELPPKQILEEQVLERLIIEEIQLQIGEKATFWGDKYNVLNLENISSEIGKIPYAILTNISKRVIREYHYE